MLILSYHLVNGIICELKITNSFKLEDLIYLKKKQNESLRAMINIVLFLKFSEKIY